jgi:MFS family permease
MSTTSQGTTPPQTRPGGHPQRWLVLGVICLAQLIVVLGNTVLNVAISSPARELGAGTPGIQWTINAYSVVRSGVLLTAGSAADRYSAGRCWSRA